MNEFIIINSSAQAIVLKNYSLAFSLVLRSLSSPLESRAHQTANPAMEQTLATQYGGDLNTIDTRRLYLLSLDGGGVRGLSALYILKRIMVQLNYERQTSGLPAVKPCEVFHLMGGTSTGG